MSINLVKTKSRVARGRKSKQSFSLPLLCYVSYTGTWYHRAQLYYGDPFHSHGSTWINNYKHCRVWDEIIYPFPNVYGVTVEVWKVISDHILNEILVQQWEPRLCYYAQVSLQWRHIDRDVVSNHRRFDGLLDHLFRHRSKKTSNFRTTGLRLGNSPVTGEFPSQMASDAENSSIR